METINNQPPRRWFSGPIGFELNMPMVLPFIAMKGRLGIFNIDPDIQKEIEFLRIRDGTGL